MTYALHPDAELDLANALDFYVVTAGAAVGKRFLREFERVAALVAQHPEIGTPAPKQRRSFPLRLFPYTIVYRRLDAAIQILIVRHHRQRPRYGTRRT